MISVEYAKWEQSLDDLQQLSLNAVHPRTRERFSALFLIASGDYSATTWALRFKRRDETVLKWVHDYNDRGPDAITYRRTGGAPPFSLQPKPTRSSTRQHNPSPTNMGSQATIGPSKSSSSLSNVASIDVLREVPFVGSCDERD